MCAEKRRETAAAGGEPGRGRRRPLPPGAVRGVLFDCNGTMVFDEAFHTQAWKVFLREKLGHDVDEREFHTWVHGVNGDVTVRHYLGEELEGERLHALMEEKEVLYRRLARESGAFVLAPGLEAFLDLLASRGIPAAIGTAAADGNVRFFFEELPLARWFTMDRVIHNDGTFPGKPAPDIYLRGAAAIGVPIGECLLFEDAAAGIEAGLRAGAGKICGVASMLTPEELLSCGADAAVFDYRGAEALL